jgi:hypothetical protein
MKAPSVKETTTDAGATHSDSPNTLVLFRQRVEEPSLMHGEQAISALLAAFELLSHRGSGSTAWACPFRDNALAFLLDSMSDAANLWGPSGDLLYRNRASERLAIGHFDCAAIGELTFRGRHFERRSTRCMHRGEEYVIEVFAERGPVPAAGALVGRRDERVALLR